MELLDLNIGLAAFGLRRKEICQVLKKIQNIFYHKDRKENDRQDEYIQYAQEVEHTLCSLEKYLHESNDSAAILKSGRLGRLFGD